MIEFLVDNIYIRFGGQLFRQMVGIPMGTNCAPLLADLFLYSYENEFLDKLIRAINDGKILSFRAWREVTKFCYFALRAKRAKDVNWRSALIFNIL